MDQSQPRLPLSQTSVELLLDLVEIKLGAMEVEDRDARTIWHLEQARRELQLIEQTARAHAVKRGPGRPARLPLAS